MRPDDLQAPERRLALKQRDGGVDHVILLLPDTRHCRSLIRANEAASRARFHLPGAAAMALLGAGEEPTGDALVVL